MRQSWGFTFLHTVGLLAMVLSVAAPVVAADYSLWIDRAGTGIEALTELAQRQDTCCKHFTKGQPCGNTCISAKAKCKSPPGCAC
jgi:hypothetical protein